jgi:hypothetical protein
MSDPNSTSPDILSDGPGKYILRPAVPPGGTNNFQKNEEMFYRKFKYCLLTQFVNRMSRVPLIFIWQNMQYYFIQEILVSDGIIGTAHAQNGCFQ